MSGTVALITLLLVALTALTSGLGEQNTSALKALGPDRVVVADTGAQSPSLSTSHLSTEQQDAWRRAENVDVVPVGIGQARVNGEDDDPAAVFGLPEGVEIPGKDRRIETGDIVRDDDLAYSHMSVAWTDLQTWQELTHQNEPTALLLYGEKNAMDSLPTVTGTQSLSMRETLNALPSYASERGSLLTMQALLYAISALVIVAFLSIWTMQRTRDIAVMRSLGASRRYVLRDALGGAAVCVCGGVLVGTVLAAALMGAVAGVVPVSLSATTVLGPAIGVVVLGMIAAWLATRRITTISPKIVLGAQDA